MISQGPFQPKAFYDSMILSFGKKENILCIFFD